MNVDVIIEGYLLHDLTCYFIIVIKISFDIHQIILWKYFSRVFLVIQENILLKSNFIIKYDKKSIATYF